MAICTTRGEEHNFFCVSIPTDFLKEAKMTAKHTQTEIKSN
jgi:hypothetical protein